MNRTLSLDSLEINEIDKVYKLDEIVLEAKNNEKIMNKLIQLHEDFISKSASFVLCDYISKYDEEWTMALTAFVEAIKNYSITKGNFLNYAEIIIRQYLNNFNKHTTRYTSYEKLFDIEYFNEINISESLNTYVDNSLRLEAILLNDILSSYNFSLLDVVGKVPKSKKDIANFKIVVKYILSNDILLYNLKVKKILPIEVIKNNTSVKKKTLEKYKLYIITTIEILSGNYEYLQGFINPFKENKSKYEAFVLSVKGKTSTILINNGYIEKIVSKKYEVGQCITRGKTYLPWNIVK